MASFPLGSLTTGDLPSPWAVSSFQPAPCVVSSSEKIAGLATECRSGQAEVPGLK